MPIPLREEHREATKRRILRALMERLAVDHPAEISVPAVARQAGISVATLYPLLPLEGKAARRGRPVRSGDGR